MRKINRRNFSCLSVVVRKGILPLFYGKRVFSFRNGAGGILFFSKVRKKRWKTSKRKKVFFCGRWGVTAKNRAAPIQELTFKCRDNRLLYFFFSTDALMKLMNRGWGFSTVLLYSGWNCVPTYHVHLGTSTISTRLLVGLIPVLASPFASNSSL